MIKLEIEMIIIIVSIACVVRAGIGIFPWHLRPLVVGNVGQKPTKVLRDADGKGTMICFSWSPHSGRVQPQYRSSARMVLPWRPSGPVVRKKFGYALRSLRTWEAGAQPMCGMDSTSTEMETVLIAVPEQAPEQAAD